MRSGEMVERGYGMIERSQRKGIESVGLTERIYTWLLMKGGVGDRRRCGMSKGAREKGSTT